MPGKITAGTEPGWDRAINPEGVHDRWQGVPDALVNKGLLIGTIEPIAHPNAGTQHKLTTVDLECLIPVPFAALYEPLLECGTTVSKGLPVSLLHHFDRFDLER